MLFFNKLFKNFNRLMGGYPNCDLKFGYECESSLIINGETKCTKFSSCNLKEEQKKVS